MNGNTDDLIRDEAEMDAWFEAQMDAYADDLDAEDAAPPLTDEERRLADEAEWAYLRREFGL